MLLGQFFLHYKLVYPIISFFGPSSLLLLIQGMVAYLITNTFLFSHYSSKFLFPKKGKKYEILYFTILWFIFTFAQSEGFSLLAIILHIPLVGKGEVKKSMIGNYLIPKMDSQRERVKEKLEKHQRENKKTPIPDLGAENVPMDETLTGEGN